MSRDSVAILKAQCTLYEVGYRWKPDYLTISFRCTTNSFFWIDDSGWICRGVEL